MKISRPVRIFAWALIIASFPMWVIAITATPFFPLPAAHRVIAATVIAASGEAMFWIGGAILGAAVVAKFRRPKVTTGRSYAGKRVAVLGATGGLGAAIAHALRREGAEVVALARDPSRLDEPLREGAIQADVTSAASLAAAAERLEPVDTLVVATGADVCKDLAAHSAADIATILEVNLAGTILTTQAFLPVVKDGGTIGILGGFGDGRLALPYCSVDVASRAGVAGFCEAMNRELPLEGRDVRLSYICPAPADAEAERAYAELWTKLRSPPAPPERVADFVIATLLQRRGVAVMGRRNWLIAWVDKLSPYVADRLWLRRAGRLLRDTFSSGAQMPPPE